MDYNFISVAEFRELDENGLLLESGTYDGRCQSAKKTTLEIRCLVPSFRICVEFFEFGNIYRKYSVSFHSR